MSKKIQESSWGIPIAVDWGENKETQKLEIIPADATSPRPVTETVVLTSTLPTPQKS